LARLEFRAVFAMTCFSTGATLALVVALIGTRGGTGAILGMAAGELVFSALAWRVLLARRAAVGGAAAAVAPSSAFS
ncbi:MAG TPA: hypothetical protein VKB80_05645, partial [Kofleriaceae bacterium]|nr:hypothetical protein [Kofleriaceae bacterium]